MFVVENNRFRMSSQPPVRIHKMLIAGPELYRFWQKWRNANLFQLYSQMDVSGFGSIHEKFYKEVWRRFISTALANLAPIIATTRSGFVHREKPNWRGRHKIHIEGTRTWPYQYFAAESDRNTDRTGHSRTRYLAGTSARASEFPM